MKKKIFLASAVLVAAMSVAISTYDSVRNQVSELALANIEALTQYESSYKCHDACIEWKGNSGGGIACDCGRYVGKCKRRCP